MAFASASLFLRTACTFGGPDGGVRRAGTAGKELEPAIDEASSDKVEAALEKISGTGTMVH
jgi:hypothetical protein